MFPKVGISRPGKIAVGCASMKWCQWILAESNFDLYDGATERKSTEAIQEALVLGSSDRAYIPLLVVA